MSCSVLSLPGSGVALEQAIMEATRALETKRSAVRESVVMACLEGVGRPTHSVSGSPSAVSSLAMVVFHPDP